MVGIIQELGFKPDFNLTGWNLETGSTLSTLKRDIANVSCRILIVEFCQRCLASLCFYAR